MCLCVMGEYRELGQHPSRIKTLKMIMLSRCTDQLWGCAYANFPTWCGAQLLHQSTARESWLRDPTRCRCTRGKEMAGVLRKPCLLSVAPYRWCKFEPQLVTMQRCVRKAKPPETSYVFVHVDVFVQERIWMLSFAEHCLTVTFSQSYNNNAWLHCVRHCTIHTTYDCYSSESSFSLSW